VAGGAGSARILTVRAVASKATQTLMNADRRAIISGIDLPLWTGRVALVAKRLALIWRDINRTFSLEHLRKRKFGNRNMLERTPVKEANGRPCNFLLRARNTLSLHRSEQHGALPVHAVASEAWNHGAAGKFDRFQQPRSSPADRSNELANGSLEVHPMATKAIVH
jgi:hypothetical protein